MDGAFDSALSAFIDGLARTEVSERTFNQFAYRNDNVGAANAIRRENLRLYLEQMAVIQPRVLMVGEAPGYRGMRLTGIPFMSEYMLLNGLPALGLFGSERGYRKTDETERAGKEQSGTILWGTLAEFRPVPLLWGAFPFHPHKPGDAWSNRAPTTGELLIGQPFLREIIRLFPVEKIIAVGNKAEESLGRMGVDIAGKVRHPAQGGKNDFVAGLRSALAEYRR
ncbi:MAG: uracil-DNA glycosylase [Burkholderiales bacterium]|nr:uracil-DNA glycosylase [Anaerolineae bacterium]